MKKIYFVLISFVLTTSFIYSQGSAGEEAKYEYRSLVDMQTAGILEKGFVGVTTDYLPNGVVIAKLEVGVFTNVSFGISYGGSNIIGTGTPGWYKYPGVNFKVRLINESPSFPAITLGFDSQGKGEYFDQEKRYAIKSPGFFAATSKNFGFLGYMSLHATVNYSLEETDGDNFTNLTIGAEKTLGSSVSFICEYNFAWNDNKQTGNFGNGNGYLNAGIRWAMGSGFTLGLDLRDLLDNKKLHPSSADRAIRMEYIKSIF
ncbi:MAG: hypothetical protein WB779_09565 [Ignavibacteriaceae bacterium]|jgi:hypothetical protein